MQTPEHILLRLKNFPSSLRASALCRRVILSTLLLVFFAVAAETASASGGYAGAGIGIAESSFDRNSVKFDAPDTVADETAWRLFGGYRQNDYLGIEAGYVYLGKAKVSEKAMGDSYETEVSGFDVTAVGSLPMGKDFSVFARGGVIFWRSAITYRLDVPGTGTRSRSGKDLVLGLGANYEFANPFTLRAEFTLYDIDKTEAGSGDFKVVLISALLSF